MLGELAGSSVLEAAPSVDGPRAASLPRTKPVYCRIRDDLKVSLQTNAGKMFYLVEDPYSGRFYRMGPREWQVASELDGQTSVQNLLSRLHGRGEAMHWTSEKASSLCAWLVQSRLATVCDAEGGHDQDRTRQLQRPVRSQNIWNPFFIKIPLCRPDRLLGELLPYTRFLLSRPAFVIWLGLCLVAADILLSNWSRFAESAAIYLAPETWLWLATVWIALKIVHELFHGLVCKKYQGFVSELGVVLILFSPVAYVDVTSSWRFRDKWARIYTSAAGMYGEFAVAAIAALVWNATGDGALNQVCHSVVITASVTTLLFNANPLMRFDGYYILSDLLEIQNLYTLGRQSSQAAFQRWFLGGDQPGPVLDGWKRPLVAIYGVASAVWRVLVTASLLIGAAALFHGAGVVMAVFGTLTWIVRPLLQFVRGIMTSKQTTGAGRGRLLKLSLAMALVLVAVLMAPRPGGITVPAVVTYADATIVRAESRGFVENVHVHHGTQVAEGDLLVTLRGDDLRAELHDVELQWEQCQLRARSLNSSQEIAATQAELERLAALTERRSHLRKQYDNLSIRAPVGGCVVDLHLDRLLGTYVEVGQPILKLASESDKEVHITIPERAYDAFAQQLDTRPTVVIRGYSRKIHDAQLARLEPKATTVLRHPAWAATHGGPLPVRANEADEQQHHESSRFRLVEPRFHGVVELPEDVSLSLRDGQVGKVRLRESHQAIGRWVYQHLCRWVEGKRAAYQGQ